MLLASTAPLGGSKHLHASEFNILYSKVNFLHDIIRLNIPSVLLTEKRQPFNSWPYGDLFYTVKFYR